MAKSNGSTRKLSVKDICAIVFFGAIAICLLPVLIPVALAYFCYCGIRDHVYYLLNRGKIIFVVDGRHGWREVILNNAIPALPAGIDPIWYQSRVLGGIQSLVVAGKQIQRPFLGLVTVWGIKKISVHDKLLRFKTYGKRDPNIGKEIRSIIENAVQELGRTTSPTV
ncbi:MAG: hypothetical protein M0D55_16040 [Elusimicrobiota bacterium]|nr:MAG: hypothetical protein M0D55_16040 [Elusimicrobiota bacterium]